MKYTPSCIVVAVNGFGYSVLGGFRVGFSLLISFFILTRLKKLYLATNPNSFHGKKSNSKILVTCKELYNIAGPQCAVQYLNYRDDLSGEVIVACSDRSIRLYDMTSSKMVSCIPKVESDVTALQVRITH